MLQKIAELDREGRSFASIAHYLNEHGFTSASGKSWKHGMVAHLLYGTGRKRESLENIGEHSLSGNHRSSGTRARLPEIATEFNKRQIRRRGGTANYAQRRWYYLNRVQRQPKK